MSSGQSNEVIVWAIVLFFPWLVLGSLGLLLIWFLLRSWIGGTWGCLTIFIGLLLAALLLRVTKSGPLF